MSDLSVSWTAVTRSDWRERVNLGARVLTAGVAAATALVLAFHSQALAAAGAGVAMLATWLAARNVAASVCRSWSVGRDGRVCVRWDNPGLSTDVTADFVCSFLIVLRHENRKLEVWRDATPVTAFRRLSTAVRWRAQRLPA